MTPTYESVREGIAKALSVRHGESDEDWTRFASLRTAYYGDADAMLAYLKSLGAPAGGTQVTEPTYDRERDIERTEWALDVLGIPADHTSGTMRCRYRIIGAHVHCALFGPYSGKAGDLVFRLEEWGHVQRIHPGWQFHQEAAVGG